MQRGYPWPKIVLSAIVIALLLAYTFIAYMPHGHMCVDTDCVICNMADSENSILINTALLSMTQLFPLLMFLLPFAPVRIVSLGESTPVGLKDKLSD